eukprot:CAMPEP_0183522502 /NCGR_PEP_ID=MMETSP0371-20130417/18488_1 /TAXON_ID=268820 /ORGANISM="Peridinium aciculiferum, Strain PAER-2" /LENGTH=128 /DNA_ID=CAMNT_0025721285 /DNA_START=8 /DNA_END=390 /DNA_ORIENTATION=-
MSLSWTQLQRKIMVSLLVNHRFWGRESRHVLNSLKPPHANSIGEELTPEQWRCLFERVKAQGLASILPVGNEADNPGFLEGKTRHDDAPGLPVAAAARFRAVTVVAVAGSFTGAGTAVPGGVARRCTV